MAPVLGALFAIMIGMIAIRPYLSYQQQSFSNIMAANTASQFRQMIDATKAYVISTCLPNAANGNVIPPGCQNVPVANVLTTLQAGGYLPAGVTTTNPYGQSWSFTVVPGSNSGTVQALLYSTGGTQISAKQAPAIAAETGQDAGFVPYPNQYGSSTPTNTALGSYGHWSAALPIGVTAGPGDLVALLNVGVGSTTNPDYLYRRQVPGDNTNQLNTMQTDLNMGGNNINNANSVNVVAGASTSGTQATTPFLAKITGVTNDPGPTNSSGQSTFLPGGMLETASPVSTSLANTSIVESDSSGSSVIANSVTSPSGGTTTTNTATMMANSTQASLTLQQNGSGGLKLISTPQTAGNLCTSAGTISPNTDSSGIPLVCVNNTQSGLEQWQKMVAFTSSSTAPVGGASSFTIGANSTSPAYQNNSGAPEFVSTNCTPVLTGNTQKFYVFITVYAPNQNGGIGAQLSNSGGKVLVPDTSWFGVGGNSGQNSPNGPSTSAIIPAGDFFEINIAGNSDGSTKGSCTLMVVN